MLSFIAVEAKDDKTNDCGYVKEQLQHCGHARLLSISMPPSSKPMPMRSISTKIYHFGRSCSKTSYRGVKTSNSVPASRRASPIISSVNFLDSKVTSVLCSLSFPLGQFLVFQITGGEQSAHGITEQIRILSVVKAPCHLVEVGRRMLRADLTPRAYNTALRKAKRNTNPAIS